MMDSLMHAHVFFKICMPRELLVADAAAESFLQNVHLVVMFDQIAHERENFVAHRTCPRCLASPTPTTAALMCEHVFLEQLCTNESTLR
jgi:hypothetical protein